MNILDRAAGTYDRTAEIDRITADWTDNPRWQHASRTYSADNVVRLRGSMKRDNMLAYRGAEKLWKALTRANGNCISALDAATGADAVHHVQAGVEAIHLSGQPIATVRQINHAFERADQLQWKAGKQPDSADYIDYFAPLIADAEIGFSTALSAYELTQNLIRAGAAGVHFGDQQTNSTGETVLVSAQDAVQQLIAARLAADVEDVPALIVARTHANLGDLLLAECAACDQPFVVGELDEEGFYRVSGGIELAIARGLAYTPHADVLWLEMAQPDLAAAKQFAEAIRREYPNQLLAFSCSGNLDAALQRELAALGYALQFTDSDRKQTSIDSRAA
jgi:isocitrate lyase